MRSFTHLWWQSISILRKTKVVAYSTEIKYTYSLWPRNSIQQKCMHMHPKKYVQDTYGSIDSKVHQIKWIKKLKKKKPIASFLDTILPILDPPQMSQFWFLKWFFLICQVTSYCFKSLLSLFKLLEMTFWKQYLEYPTRKKSLNLKFILGLTIWKN